MFTNHIKPALESIESPPPVLFSAPPNAVRPLVAVLDSGVDWTHSALSGAVWRNPREIAGNGKDDDGNGFKDDSYGWSFATNNARPMDGDGHGTHVAGIIVQAGCAVQAVKVLRDDGLGQEAWIAAGIRYAQRSGARVISLSLGGYEPVPKIAAAVKDAIKAGCIVCAAAGNDGVSLHDNPIYPACLAGVLSVMALDGAKLWSSSNTGARIAAPGKSIYSALPGNRWGRYSGTSMATPAVAASCARVWQQRPQWTAWQVVDWILRMADQDRDIGRKLNLARALAELE